jgi:hypothetical protein
MVLSDLPMAALLYTHTKSSDATSARAEAAPTRDREVPAVRVAAVEAWV